MSRFTTRLTSARVVALGVWVALLAFAPAALAQKGMTKSEYYDYLVRTGRAQEVAPISGEALQGLSKTLGPADLKKNVLNIGNVRARIRNSSTLGYDRDLLSYEFPFNSGITYRWTMGPMVAGRKIVDGQERKFVSGAAFGAVRGTTEDEFRPLAGYDSGEFSAVENIGIAFSDKPASWPASWPTLDEAVASNGDHIISSAARDAFLNNPNFDASATGTAIVGPNGFPGIAGGEVKAPREAYFVATDNDPTEPGVPIPMDIRVDVWALQWDDFVNRNFIIYKLLFTNVGDQTLTDVYVGIHDDPDTPSQGSSEWTDDYAYLVPPGKDSDGDGTPDPDADPRADVDGDGVYSEDDILLWNTVYLWDGDDQSQGFISSGVGWIGLKFLETPVDPATGEPRGVTTLDIFKYSAAPNTDATGYDQMAGLLHVGLEPDDSQQGGSQPIQLPDWPEGAPDDIFGIPNSYGPDVTVTAASGPYTLAPGESLPFTFASVHGSTRADLVNNARLTQILFNNDYNSASGPPIPNVQAVASDGQVTLYWDDTAELGIYPDGTIGDPLTGNNAFQGYKIYRSDDGGQTFGQEIIDFQGSGQGFIPLATFDLADGTNGESPTRRYFDLGTDSGLQHKFVDTNVENGKEYLYAVVAYDGQDGPVPPLETPINLANPDAPNDNTVRVRPMAKPAGVVPGTVEAVARQIAGNADVETLDLEVVDPTALQSGTYQISFTTDTTGTGFTVTRDGQVVSDMSGRPVQGVGLFDAETDFAPVFDGMRAYVVEVPFGFKEEAQTGSGGLELSRVTQEGGTSANLAADYEIRFTDRMWTYGDWNTGNPVMAPFEVFNITTGEKIHAEPRDDNEDGQWQIDERVYFSTVPYPDVEADAGQWLGGYPDDYPYYVLFTSESTFAPGDVFSVFTNKPYTPADVYEFTVTGPAFNAQALEEDLEEITVVPNPFTVSSEYEIGAFGVQKQLQFHQLPEQCTIKIFTIAGDLVQVLEHDGGSVEAWNLQTYNGQEVAYGVYLYLVETPEGMEHTGKFAIIK